MPQIKNRPAAPGMTPEEFTFIVNECGMKVKDIARTLGVSRQSIFDWRKGNAPINKVTATAIRSLLPIRGR